LWKKIASRGGNDQKYMKTTGSKKVEMGRRGLTRAHWNAGGRGNKWSAGTKESAELEKNENRLLLTA